mmetsp:Transcript_45836/g.55631  ORF Transcript_45836/g.55631 Transcript_45836/m.55631 type:complete len:81 (+) Transcript_45836:70-312(+)
MMQHNSVDSSEALIASPTDSNEKIRDDSMAVIYFHSHWNPLSWRDNEANIAATAIVRATAAVASCEELYQNKTSRALWPG